MYEEMLLFLKENQVGVLAVEMLDNSPHAAALHFAFDSDSLEFIFLTESSYRKCERVLEKGSAHGSFVVGTNDADMRTLQIDGEVTIDSSDEVKEIYTKRFPDKGKYFNDPEAVLLKLKPTWWRYTDYTKPEGKTILNSDGEEKVV